MQLRAPINTNRYLWHVVGVSLTNTYVLWNHRAIGYEHYGAVLSNGGVCQISLWAGQGHDAASQLWRKKACESWMRLGRLLSSWMSSLQNVYCRICSVKKIMVGSCVSSFCPQQATFCEINTVGNRLASTSSLIQIC